VQTKEEEEEDSFAGYSCCNQVCAHKLVCGYASLGYLHTTALEHFRVHCAAFVVVSAHKDADAQSLVFLRLLPQRRDPELQYRDEHDHIRVPRRWKLSPTRALAGSV
jgi:hypothetical protein